jgi:uncharacterized protein (TIGR02118 family)
MIKVSVMYPHRVGARFDFKYYRATHTPMVLERLGAACKRYSVDKGLTQMRPAAPPLYVAICHLEFESVDASAPSRSSLSSRGFGHAQQRLS